MWKWTTKILKWHNETWKINKKLKTLLQNIKYSNVFKISDSWQYCTRNQFYFVSYTLTVVFQAFVHILYIFWLIDSSPCSASYFFFFPKISSFVKRDFQIWGCIFVTEWCIDWWMPIAYSWSIVICLLIDIPWERRVQLWAFKHPWPASLQRSVFQNKKPILGGKPPCSVSLIKPSLIRLT